MINSPLRRHGLVLSMRGSAALRPVLKATGVRKRRRGRDHSDKDLQLALCDWKGTDFVERNSRADGLPHVAGWLLRVVLSRCRFRWSIALLTTRRCCTLALWTRSVCFLLRCPFGGHIDSGVQAQLVVEAPSLSSGHNMRPLLGQSRSCSTSLALHPVLRRCRGFFSKRRHRRKHREHVYRSAQSRTRPPW